MAGLLAGIVAVFLLVRVVGFWSQPARSAADAAVQTVQAVGIALVSVTVVLVVLRRLTWAMPLSDAIGTVVYESIPFAVGAAISASAIRGSKDDIPPRQDSGKQRQGARATIRDLGATAIGAMFIGLSIAPTDEIPALASSIPTPWLLAVIALSLGVSYTIVFASGFLDGRKRRAQAGLLQRPVTETLASYLVALTVAALMLWVFRNLALNSPWQQTLSQVLVLGLPAAVGGSAGRVVA